MSKKYDPAFAFRNKRKSNRQPNHNYGGSPTHFVTMQAETHDPIFEKPATLAQVIDAYKSIAVVTWLRHIETNNIHAQARIWQNYYYDRIIRTHEELENTRQYIRNNPTSQKNKNPNST